MVRGMRLQSLEGGDAKDGLEETRFGDDFDAIGLIKGRDIGRNREISVITEQHFLDRIMSVSNANWPQTRKTQ